MTGPLASRAQLLGNSKCWWDNAVGYQIYVPSFADYSGDGVGDLNGITSHLPDIRDLGVDLIWLTPFFPSPHRDHGYDISDYRAIDPRDGTLADFDTMLATAHDLGLKVVLDLVVNHTSDPHPWFQASRDPVSPYRSWYHWRRGEGTRPPNNWVSSFGGPAWTYDDRSEAWYLHLFSPHQPDLNWATPAVAEAVDDIMKFWLERGVSGFRIDTASYLAKHPGYPDNPRRPASAPRIGGANASDWYQLEHLHDIDQLDDVLALHRRWRELADRYDALLFGEVYVLERERLQRFMPDDGLHSTFWFGPFEHTWDPQGFVDMHIQTAAEPFTVSWALSNHDRSRAPSRLGGIDRAVAVQTLQAGLLGIFWLYQGDELMVRDGIIEDGVVADPLSHLEGGTRGREPSRTPYPWHDGPGHGFTSSPTPWLPSSPAQGDTAYTVQRADSSSHWHRVRELITLRKQTPLSEVQTVQWQPGEIPGSGTLEVGQRKLLVNLSDKPVVLNASAVPPETSTWLCKEIEYR